MKIFLDDFCFNCINVVIPYGTTVPPADAYKKYQHIDQLPDDCDLISVSFCDCNYSAHAQVIQQLLAKSRRLIVVIIEPTGDFYPFVQAHSDPRIVIFSPVIANFSAANLHTLVTWFDHPDNYYAVEDWAKKLQSQLRSDWNRLKRFDCLLGANKPHRDQVDQLYQSSAYQDQFIYSYFKDRVNQGIWSRNVDRAKTTTHRVRADPLDGRFVAIAHLLPVDIYNESVYSIVAETVSTNQYSHFTEKTGKTFVAGRPFVVFTGQYYLRNLRTLGFQTFGAVIDESYDVVEDDTERFALAWQQVELLCQLDPASVMQELQSVIAHNRQHFLSTSWMDPVVQVIQSVALN
jgi:hypothetical protein